MMPIITKGIETRFISQVSPVPDGWEILRDATDVELQAGAEEYFRSRVRTYAEGLATNIAGIPMNVDTYDFHVALLQSTTNFNIANLQQVLVDIKQVVDHAKTLISDASTMTITQMDEYDLSGDIGWSV